jgi:serine/threonine-protein kinase
MLAELEALSEAHEKRKAAVCLDRSIANHAASAPGGTRGTVSGGTHDETARLPERPAASVPRRPRSRPVKVHPGDAPAVFHSDSLGRPVEIVANDFASAPLPQGAASPEHHPSPKPESSGTAPATVFDRATGLLWEVAGSPLPLKHEEARDYVSDLNRTAFGGRTDWRLPTVNEIFSVLKPSLAEDRHCLPDLFPPDRKWLWTCDLRSFAAAWYVDCESGFAGWGDFSCRFYVRAVSSPGSSTSRAA